ncbi:MAG: MerR family transcriptional regulator [Acidobacteriia bacterium]|nr:MerR family transcriptional regulator [Terriglobia bacterium]
MASMVANNPYIKIGTLARNAQVSLRTLRYYEEIGLISPASHSQGGHRLYTSEDMKRLEVINYLKSLPLSLEEIREIFTIKKTASARDKKEQVALLIKALYGKLNAVNTRLRELTEVKDELSAMVEILKDCARCEGKPFLKSETCGDCRAVDRRDHVPLIMSVFLEKGV